jgi:hypothetical protein
LAGAANCTAYFLGSCLTLPNLQGIIINYIIADKTPHTISSHSLGNRWQGELSVVGDERFAAGRGGNRKQIFKQMLE